tara:strand:+ start:1654 stop:2262 length:609 start_codon:yes stop_codon:yes gene_type:complete
MSGSKAIAAAKNRRAGGNSRPPPPPRSSARAPQPPSSQESLEYNPNPFQEEQQKPANARAMLIGHDQSILVLREAVTNLELQTTGQIKKTQEQIKSLSLDDSNIEYFKTKIANIEKQMNEIKKHIIKVQTFAMETNLQCIEMKKQKEDNVDSNTLNEQQLEQAEEVSSILTNDHNEELVNDISNDLIQEVENEGSKKEINFN